MNKLSVNNIRSEEMGYQESLVYIQPQSMFDKMIKIYQGVYETGYYKTRGAEPLSIITIKKPVLNIPEDTKLLWVVGDRCFHNKDGIFDARAKEFFFCNFKVIPVEEMFKGLGDEKLKGISLNINKPTENDFLKRESVREYAKQLGHKKDKSSC